MTINYTYHEGSQSEKPKAIDETSSKRVVYLRRNIRQIEREDPVSGEIITIWGYEEAQLTHEEYTRYLIEDAASKTAYVAMMSDIDL